MQNIDFTNIDLVKVTFPKITAAVYAEDAANLVHRLRKANSMLAYRTANGLSTTLVQATVALLNRRIDVEKG
jgi:hypothetical protein